MRLSYVVGTQPPTIGTTPIKYVENESNEIVLVLAPIQSYQAKGESSSTKYLGY